MSFGRQGREVGMNKKSFTEKNLQTVLFTSLVIIL